MAGRSSLTVELLSKGQEGEVLDFLAVRPMQTVMLAGFIRDNGLESPLNRGEFYVCRSESDEIEGVALIGEITTFEVRTNRSLAAFAQCAKQARKLGVIIGEQESIERFWRLYADTNKLPTVLCRELLFELRWPVEVSPFVPELRLAKPADFDSVVAVHAELAVAESGINPLELDPEGFRQRCARRIQQGRVWVCTDEAHLIFKADVISETPDVIYLEGIYVAENLRGKGYGFRCLSQLARHLLANTKSLCLLVNAENKEAQSLYRKCRFKFRGRYDTIFLAK